MSSEMTTEDFDFRSLCTMGRMLLLAVNVNPAPDWCTVAGIHLRDCPLCQDPGWELRK